MALNLDDVFVIGISSSALFDTKEGDAIFCDQGTKAFVEYQVAQEETPFGRGTAFPLIQAILRLKKLADPKSLMEVIILSHNHPAAGLRAMNSVDHYKLAITRAAFVGATPISEYLKAYHVSLFLSRNLADVRDAIGRGVAAGQLLDPPADVRVSENQLRIAFDGDSVLFSDASDRVWKEQGSEKFFAHETQNERTPLPPGPFAEVVRWIARIQKEATVNTPDGAPIPVRTALVTARNGPAVKRVIRTLRHWNVEIDEMFFLGDIPKTEVLHAFKPHIFFDDSMKNVEPASKFVPSAWVPYGPHAEAVRAIGATTKIVEVPSRAPETVLVGADRMPVDPTAVDPGRLTKLDFETRCRSIFRSYTPLSSNRREIDSRYRVFLSEHADRTAEERWKIHNRLRIYDLSGMTTHEPMLNREVGDIVLRKLARIGREALAGSQETWTFEDE